MYCVVEVLGGLAVDRDERELAQVLAPGRILFAHGVGQALGLGQRLFREFVRQVELAQRNLDLHAGVLGVAEDLRDAADRLRVLGRLGHEFDGHHLPGLGLADLGRRHEDVLRDPPVFRDEKQHAMLGMQPADHAPVAPLENVDDLAGRPAARVAPGHLHRCAVAVQHLAHFGRGQEHRLAALVRDEEPVAITMPFDPA